MLSFMHAQYSLFQQGYNLLDEIDPYMKKLAAEVSRASSSPLSWSVSLPVLISIGLILIWTIDKKQLCNGWIFYLILCVFYQIKSILSTCSKKLHYSSNQYFMRARVINLFVTAGRLLQENRCFITKHWPNMSLEAQPVCKWKLSQSASLNHPVSLWQCLYYDKL